MMKWMIAAIEVMRMDVEGTTIVIDETALG